MDTLYAIAAASLRALGTLAACAAVSGFVLRRERGVPLDVFDVGAALLAVIAVTWQARGVVRPGFHETRLRSTKVTLPSTSGADLVVDALFIALGVVLVWIEWAHPSVGTRQYGLGAGFVVVPSLLAALRVTFWRRRPTE